MDAKNFTPRLPKSYYNTYRQYKENESRIVQWIHRTAGELRTSTRCASSASSRRSRPRGNKSRSNHGESRKAALDPDLASPKLSLRTLLELAREISASDVVIPASYIALLELSIKQRKTTAAFFSPDAQVSEDNKAHLHAIKAYSEVLKILKEAEEKRTEKDGDLPGGDIRGALMLGEADNFALSEAIQHLSVLVQQESGFGASQVDGGSAENEWIRDNPLVNSPGKRPKIPSFPLEEYGLVLDDDFDPKTDNKKPAHDETFDRLRCFLLDVNDLRKYCNMVWKQVAPAGNLSYVTASFVTNMAVQMVKQIEYTLVSDFPSLKDIDQAYVLLYNVIIRYQLLDNRTQDQFDSLNDQMMYYTWDALHQFAELLKVNNSPALRDGHFGYFDPAADRSKMSSKEKYREDRCILLNHWPDLIIVNDKIRTTTGSVDNHFLGSQGLVADFKKFCKGKTHTVTWALVFACQMQSDSVQARRRYLDYDLQIMRNLGSEVLKEYHHFQNDGVLYGENMSKAAKPFVEYAVATIEDWVSGDVVTDIKLHNNWDKYSKQATQKDSLWLQNPWLTANFISEITLDYFYAGVCVAGAGGFVQSAIQLWNMLRQMGYLPPRDSSLIVEHDSNTMKEHVLLFDHLMDVFGEKVFSGPPPKSAFLKQWELMTGIRAEEFARGKRQFKKTADKQTRPRSHEAGRGMLPNMSELLLIHRDKYFPKDRSDSQKRGSDFKHPLAAIVELVNSELGHPSKSSTAPLKGPFLNLNLLKVHRLCIHIFTELEPVLRPKIESILGVPLDHTQIQWPYLVGWIARSEQFPGNNGLPSRLLLSVAADVVQRLAGDQQLGHFLVRYDADENLILH